MESQPVRFLAHDYHDLLDISRVELAEFLGCSAEDVVFSTNATSGVNAVVNSLRFEPGDELLTTDHVYNACRNVLDVAAERSGARLILAHLPFPLDSEAEVASTILDAVTDRTRLVLLDHITSPTALLLPVERIVEELEGRGIPVLIDGAHAPGQIPLDLGALRPSYYAGNLHKWLCAPKGCAFLYARDDRREELRPAVTSHGENRRRAGRSPFHDRFDWCGTSDPTAWFCAGEAIRWCDGLIAGGIAALRERNHALAVEARALLATTLGCAEMPCPEGMLGSMATLPLPTTSRWGATGDRIDPQQRWLWEHGRIEVPIMRTGNSSRRGIRVSAQAYNAIGQYEFLANALLESERG